MAGRSVRGRAGSVTMPSTPSPGLALRNPWLPPSPTPEGDPAAGAVTPAGGPAPARGPVRPQRGVPAPDSADQLPRRSAVAGVPLWVVGAHGGAGESTVAALERGWRASGHCWPQLDDTDVAVTDPARVILVCRSHYSGLRAAQKAIAQWAAGLVPGLEFLGLVVIADAPGKLPRELRDFSRLVAAGAPRSWSLPWVPSWRLHPPVSPLPGDVGRVRDQLSHLTTSSTPQP